jgi:adenylylsulfate kinase
MLVIMAGLPASGKTTLARALAKAVGGVVLDKDVIRPALFPAPDIEYTAAQDDFVMDVMLQTSRYLLTRDPSRIIFIDGRTFSRAYQRQVAIDFAERVGTSWLMIECVCSEASARLRLAEDRHHPAANRTFDLWESVRGSFEPIGEPKLVVDTDGPFEACLRAALEAIDNKQQITTVQKVD